MSQGGGEPGEAPSEPSMEEILASIRRILNDDETLPPAEAASVEANPPGADVFELEPSMIVEEPAEPMIFSPPADLVHAAPLESEPLLAPAAAAAAAASMGALVRVLEQRTTPIYRGGPTLEDIVRDELRPLLKTWLDENLPPMVERAVRSEIERVTRGGV